MFIKIVFFFLIGNVALGIFVAQLNSDPIDNPNTTLFSDRNITTANVTSSVNVTEFHASQFEPPTNSTGDPIDDVFGFFEDLDFLNLSELYRFTQLFEAVFVTNQIDQMLTLIGVEFADGVIDGLFIIITFSAIMWFIFVIFKVGASSFN